MIFPEGLQSVEEFKFVAEEVRGKVAAAGTGNASRRAPYLLANMTEFGRTPPIPLATFTALGYDAVIYPVTTLRAAMAAVTSVLTQLKATGQVSWDGLQTRQELYDLLKYDPATPWLFPGKLGGDRKRT